MQFKLNKRTFARWPPNCKDQVYGELGQVDSSSRIICLVKNIKFVFSKLLTTKAISIYDDGLVGKIIECINKVSTMIYFYLLFYQSHRKKG